MKKIWNIEAIPSLLALAMFGSAATAWFYAGFDRSLLILFAFPACALIGDLFLNKIEYLADQSPTTFNFFSYIPRIGLSLFISIKYVISLWAVHYPKEHGYQFPFDLYLKLTVLGAAVYLIAAGITAGRQKPKKYWFNPNPIWINSSTLAFKKTHRLLGWASIVIGILALVVDVVNPMAAFLFIVCVGVPIFMAIWLGYSYFVWKRDPEKIPVVGKS